MVSSRSLLRLLVFLFVTAVGIAGTWVLFVEVPLDLADLVGILVVVGLLPVILRVAGSTANSLAPGYNVAEVEVSGTISRSTSSGPLDSGPIGASADRLVDQIEQADDDTNAEALIVRLNTPGGEIVPSEDIKLAAERFDGPTIAYATDTCASGGYEIASGCDEIWAREGSIVGSIGVIGSRVTAAELADRLGVTYQQLTAGEFKDAGTPLKELEDEERSYLQGIVDDYYDQFVENVAARRDLAESEVRDTEARVYLGTTAAERGLVDELGTRRDVEDRLADELGRPVQVRQFTPSYGLGTRLGRGGRRLAWAVGSGLAGSLTGDSGFNFRK